MNLTILNSSALSDFFYEISRFTLRFASVLLLAYVLTLAVTLLVTWRPKRKHIRGAHSQAGSPQPVHESSSQAPEPARVGISRTIEPTPIQVLYIRRASEGERPETAPKQTHVNGESKREAQK